MALSSYQQCPRSAAKFSTQRLNLAGRLVCGKLTCMLHVRNLNLVQRLILSSLRLNNFSFRPCRAPATNSPDATQRRYSPAKWG